MKCSRGRRLKNGLAGPEREAKRGKKRRRSSSRPDSFWRPRRGSHSQASASAAASASVVPKAIMKRLDPLA